MKDLSLTHRRLVAITLVAVGALILFPGTRTLLRMQMQMETLTYTTHRDPALERAAARGLPNDYPVQLALASEIPPFFTPEGDIVEESTSIRRAKAQARNRRIAALTERFPKNPSVYANLMRYMAMGEVRAPLEPPSSFAKPHDVPYQASSESLELFVTAAQRGAELDPQNAYFPMLKAYGLFAIHREEEAIDALKTAGRCSQWTEYFQDDIEGHSRLKRAVYGDRGAIQYARIVYNVDTSHCFLLHVVARVATRMAAAKERAGNPEEAIAIRHAVMRCGGLMRAQGASADALVTGIALANIATSDAGGRVGPDSLISAHSKNELSQQENQKELRRNTYYAYLENLGQRREAEWAKTEIAAGAQALRIAREAGEHTASDDLLLLCFRWFINFVLLSSTLILALLGVAAHLASRIRPGKALQWWRAACVLLLLGGIGYWQWEASRLSSNPLVEVLDAFCDISHGNGYDDQSTYGNSPYIVGFSLLVPCLLIGLIEMLARVQRVPLAIGIGRGLRGLALPAAAVMFLFYSLSLLPTAFIESRVKAEVAGMTGDAPRYFTEITHKAWPGDPAP